MLVKNWFSLVFGLCFMAAVLFGFQNCQHYSANKPPSDNSTNSENVNTESWLSPMQTLTAASQQLMQIIVDPTLVVLKAKVDDVNSKVLNVTVSYLGSIIAVRLTATENITSYLFLDMLNFPKLDDRVKDIAQVVKDNSYKVALKVSRSNGIYYWRFGAATETTFVDGQSLMIDFEPLGNNQFKVTVHNDINGFMYFSNKTFGVEVSAF